MGLRVRFARGQAVCCHTTTRLAREGASPSRCIPPAPGRAFVPPLHPHDPPSPSTFAQAPMDKRLRRAGERRSASRHLTDRAPIGYAPAPCRAGLAVRLSRPTPRHGAFLPRGPDQPSAGRMRGNAVARCMASQGLSPDTSASGIRARHDEQERGPCTRVYE